jgi:hypothetical protein
VNGEAGVPYGTLREDDLAAALAGCTLRLGLRLYHTPARADWRKENREVTEVVLELGAGVRYSGEGAGPVLALRVLRERTGGVTGERGDNQAQGGGVVLADQEWGTSLELVAYVDHSIIEAFAQGGRAAVTSRIYPRTAVRPGPGTERRGIEPWIASLFVESSCAGADGAHRVSVSATADAWALGSCWVDPPTTGRARRTG